MGEVETSKVLIGPLPLLNRESVTPRNGPSKLYIHGFAPEDDRAALQTVGSTAISTPTRTAPVPRVGQNFATR